MSFSSQTKKELSRLTCNHRECYLAELAGIISFAGIIRNSGTNLYLKVNTENASVAWRLFNLIKKSFGIQTKVNIKKKHSIKNKYSYDLYIHNNDGLNRILKELGFITNKAGHNQVIRFRIHPSLVQAACCKRAYIRGAFLGGGSVIDPEKTYHFEFITRNYLLCTDFCDLLTQYNLNPKTILRKSNYVIYFKGSDDIIDLLNIIGAHKALLQTENIRIIKEMRNNVNRVVNCETANLEKTVNASFKQIQNIEYIKNTIGLDKIPSKLQEVAKMRLKYREASLKELGEMLSPPVGKSGVNHRLRKLQEIVEQLQIKHNNK